MNIKQTFLNLTKETYPHGTESELLHLIPNNLETDEFGNLFLKIGQNPSTMFTSHLDTASHDKKVVNHIFEGNIIKTDGTSILGADDKAGVTIMLYLIEHNIPGLYYFFLGEERGCIGSKKVANKHRNEPLSNIKKVVSFDRRGANSVITFQSGSRCCSEAFGNALSTALNEKSKVEKTINLEFNYQNDPTGVYTDSYQFVSVYPECTNISVGYMNEHTGKETQDILHLEKLCKTVVMIDWENLPVERNPKIEESRNGYSYSYYDDLGGDFWEYNYRQTKKVENKKIWFFDEKYNNHVSLISLDTYGKIKEIDLAKERIEWERELIQNFIESVDVGAEKIKYDGKQLVVEHISEYGGHETVIERGEISEYIEEL
ncbi:MAG: M28 family peptidase, partial [Crocinitomicaceae bacterium]|nr:M28 family peptidase [Crocinitomicaceae bacterium]